jgi:hypothetical protein
METCQPSVANVTQARPETPYYVKGLALGLSAYLIGIHLWTWILTVSVFLGGHSDFRQLYTAGYMVRSGHAHELYQYDAQHHFQNQLVSPADIALPFNHLAYEALLFLPFSLLPYRAAYFGFLSFNVIALAITFKFLRLRMRNLAAIYPWLPHAMFLAFLPVAAALIQGQDSILLLTLFAAALVSLHNRRELTAGVLVGLGLFKFQISIPIALLFFVWRRWRFSAGFALAATAVGLVSLSLVGVLQLGVYFRSLLLMSFRLASPVDQFKYAISPARMPNLRGLFFGLLNKHTPQFWIEALIILASVTVLVWAAVLRPRRATESFLIAITASTLVSYHLLIHDLSVLLIPIALTLDRFIEAEATGNRDGRILARAAALMFVVPVCESFIPDQFYVVALPLCVFLFTLLRHIRSHRGTNIGTRQVPDRLSARTSLVC